MLSKTKPTILILLKNSILKKRIHVLRDYFEVNIFLWVKKSNFSQEKKRKMLH